MPEAGQDAASPAGLDARYEQLRHAVLHERAHAFPLGLGLLIANGVTAWRRALTHVTAPTPSPPGPDPTSPQARPGPPDPIPARTATQLVHALAGLAVALAGT